MTFICIMTTWSHSSYDINGSFNDLQLMSWRCGLHLPSEGDGALCSRRRSQPLTQSESSGKAHGWVSEGVSEINHMPGGCLVRKDSWAIGSSWSLEFLNALDSPDMEGAWVVNDENL